MNFKRLMIAIGAIVLVAVIALSWGCQNQTTGPITKAGTPTVSGKTRDGTGSCTAGSYKVSFNGSFVAGLGWNPGSSRSISWSGSCSGCNWGPAVYGWMTNPLIEYYVPRSGGSGVGSSYSCNGQSFTLQTHQQTNQPSIEGTKTFNQYFGAGGGGSPVDMGCHFNAWSSRKGTGSNNYQVVAVENWSGGSGSASISVPNSNWYTLWTGSGSATFTCGGGGGGSTTTTTTSGGSTTTTTSGGGSTTTTSGGGGNKSYVLRARSTDGQGKVNFRIDNNTIASFTLGSSMSNYSCSSYNSGGINVQFYNDATNRDVQIDYIQANGSTRQAESQSTNTAVWNGSGCGGSNSEWMHCNGYIGFGNTP